MLSLFSWFRRSRPEVTLQSARERAARGAAYLDDVDPGWHRRLDLAALALADGQSCVLGQLHGEFRTGLGRARLFNVGSAPRASLSPVAHGFHCVRTGGDAETERHDYALLDRAWQEEVHERQTREERQREERQRVEEARTEPRVAARREEPSPKRRAEKRQRVAGREEAPAVPA